MNNTIMNTFTKITKKVPIQILSDYLLQFDGASKNNPGIAGAGYVLYKITDCEKYDEIFSDYQYIEYATNNEAEYIALLLGLKKIKELDISNITIQGDSLLIINQMNNVYKVKSSNLLNLYIKCKDLTSQIKNINFQHIKREFNKKADSLANKAIDEVVNKKSP